MSRANYQSPKGEVLVVSFLDDDHWAKARDVITEAGADFSSFIGKDGSIQPVRNLARKIRTVGSKEWQNTVSQLCNDVAEVEQTIKDSPYGFCNFGLAVPNPDYEPPVSKENPDGSFSVSFSRINGDEYLFVGKESSGRGLIAREKALTELNRPPLSRGDISIDSLAVVLQYRECF